MGPGKVLLYESDQILVDPDRHQELLHNYELEIEVVVVLSLVTAYLFETRWELPHFNKALLPNPLFRMDIASSDRIELKYTQQVLNIDKKGWVVINFKW